jgi:prolyl-tRNA editing enzyme YbaK/EbsC (Cys-tRNA(Pro) deacylase)
MTTDRLGPADLERFLRANQVSSEFFHLEALTPTVESAAAAVGCDLIDIVKSILFLIGGMPVLAIACGVGRVDARCLAAHFGVGRKKVKLADPETVLRETGYVVGAMPPFGHRTLLRTVLDRRVLDRKMVYAGGGADNALLQVSSQTILDLTHAEVLDLVSPIEGKDKAVDQAI